MSVECRAGDFELYVSDGYPYWCTLTDDRGNQIRFHHSQLRDLRYIADRGMRALKADILSSVHPKHAKQKLTAEI